MKNADNPDVRLLPSLQPPVPSCLPRRRACVSTVSRTAPGAGGDAFLVGSWNKARAALAGGGF